MKQYKYQFLDISAISFLLVRSSIILGLFNYLTDLLEEDSIIAIIFGTLLGLSIVLLNLYFNKSNPNLNFIDKINRFFPSWLGKIIKIILILVLSIISFYVLNKVTYYINYNLLNKGTIFLISMSFLLISLFLVQKGILAIVRTASIFIYFILLLIIIAPIVLIPYFDINNIKPFYTHSNSNILLGSLVYAAFSTAPLFLINLIRNNDINYKKHYYKINILNYLISSLVILINLILTNGILGIKLAKFYEFSYINIFSKISLFNFIEHVEPIFSISYLFDGLILFGLIIFWIKELVKSTFNLKKKNIANYLIYAMSFIIFIGSYYSSFLDNKVYLMLAVILLALNVILGVLNTILIKKKVL